MKVSNRTIVAIVSALALLGGVGIARSVVSIDRVVTDEAFQISETTGQPTWETKPRNVWLAWVGGALAIAGVAGVGAALYARDEDLEELFDRLRSLTQSEGGDASFFDLSSVLIDLDEGAHSPPPRLNRGVSIVAPATSPASPTTTVTATETATATATTAATEAAAVATVTPEIKPAITGETATRTIAVFPAAPSNSETATPPNTRPPLNLPSPGTNQRPPLVVMPLVSREAIEALTPDFPPEQPLMFPPLSPLTSSPPTLMTSPPTISPVTSPAASPATSPTTSPATLKPGTIAPPAISNNGLRDGWSDRDQDVSENLDGVLDGAIDDDLSSTESLREPLKDDLLEQEAAKQEAIPDFDLVHHEDANPLEQAQTATPNALQNAAPNLTEPMIAPTTSSHLDLSISLSRKDLIRPTVQPPELSPELLPDFSPESFPVEPAAREAVEETVTGTVTGAVTTESYDAMPDPWDNEDKFTPETFTPETFKQPTFTTPITDEHPTPMADSEPEDQTNDRPRDRPITQTENQPTDPAEDQLKMQLTQLRATGMGKHQILLALWNVRDPASEAYQSASELYDRLLEIIH